jgi:simple sugar transport system ATP-binding protein
VLEAHAITKSFGGVQALRGASLELRRGEVLALVGDNGAGKSTLVKILSGVMKPDSGTILMDGAPMEFSSPKDAQEHGIATVYQDLALAPDLDSIANLYLGHELVRGGLLGLLGLLDQKRMRSSAVEFLDELDIRVQNLRVPVESLSGGQRQGVAVARAVKYSQKVVFLDEPTAALGVEQTEKVLRLIEAVRDRGISVVLITHRLDEVARVADRVHVLRLGSDVATFDKQDATANNVVAAITGAAL